MRNRLASTEVTIRRPGYYVLNIERASAELPLLGLEVAHCGSPKGEPVVLPAGERTEFLLRVKCGEARLTFGESEVLQASVRTAGCVPWNAPASQRD